MKVSRVVAGMASVWMPLVALPLFPPCHYAEEMLFAKYPLFMVRHLPSVYLADIAFCFVACIALLALVCDILRRRWRRIVARIALFAAGLAIMVAIGFLVYGYMRQLRPMLEVHVEDIDVANIAGEKFKGDEFDAIIRKIYMRKRSCVECVAFVIDKDIGGLDFARNFLDECSVAGMVHCAFRTEDGDLRFDYNECLEQCYMMNSRKEKSRIAAVYIGNGGSFAYEADFQRAGCGGEEEELEKALFTDCEDDVFGEGKAAEYAAGKVLIASNDAPVSVVVACVRRLLEAGYKKVFINRM